MTNTQPSQQNQPFSEAEVANNPQRGVEFVAAHFGSTTLVAIKPDSGPVLGCYLDRDDPSSATQWAEKYNADGYNLYFTVNQPVAALNKKPRKEHMEAVRCVFGDVDAKDGRSLEQALAEVLAAPIRPSLVIASGGGFQPIWLLSEPVRVTPEATGRVEGIGARIAALLNGDAVQNIDRILRLPFTVNYPNAKKRAAGRVQCLSGIVEIAGAVNYTLEELEAAFPEGKGEGAEILSFPGPGAATGGFGKSKLNAAAQAGLSEHWFDRLSEYQKNECLECILAHPKIIRLANVDRAEWFKLLMAITDAGHRGATRARELALAWCKTSTARFVDEKTFDTDWNSFQPGKPGGTTVGTLIKAFVDAGGDTSPWRDSGPTAAAAAGPQGQSGGTTGAAPTASSVVSITSWPAKLSEAVALGLMNDAFFFAHDIGGGPAIAHITKDGLRYLSERNIHEMMDNRYVSVPCKDADGVQVGVKAVPLGKWWLANPDRREVDRVIFDPSNAPVAAGEKVYNLWTGFAVKPAPRPWKLMARHIFNVVCRRDRAAWRYMLYWLAHAVQRPGEPPGTVPVLKSGAEGAGKSSVLEWMCRIFGTHALTLSSADELTGQFNGHLEGKVLIGLNEPAFPGDYRAAGKLKSMITEPTWMLNEKFRTARRIPNIAHIMLTTNAEWAVPAGSNARRFFVLEVDARRADDRAYFNALWAEANNGGVEGMLHFLLRIDLSKADLRAVPKTKALQAQQLRSASSVVRWALDAVAGGELFPAPANGIMPGSVGFGERHTSAKLYGAYQQWAAAARERRIESHVIFGRWLSGCSFVRTKLHGVWHYTIPDASKFGVAVLQSAGIF